MKRHFKDFKYFGKDGMYDVFSVTLVTEKRKLFSRKKVIDEKTILISGIELTTYGSEIKRRYKNLSYFPSGTFLSDKSEFDTKLQEFAYSCILYMENDKDYGVLRKDL